MHLSTPIRFKGVPGSPYTRKMLALLRYRHIPYELLIGDQAAREGLPSPKVSLLPTFYLPDEDGNVSAVVDSTPLIRRFEAAFDDRGVIPSDPAMAFINYLVEDYGDEWLTKSMFHYRWHFRADIEMAAAILPLWSNLDLDPDRHERVAKSIAERQISRLYVVGSNETTAPVIEASYERFLDIMDRMIQHHPFVMGERPGSADFALYAQLTQLARFDPTPQAVCVERSPRVFAWTDVMDDLTGLAVREAGWLAAEDAQDALFPLLAEIGRTHVPVLLANAEALASDNEVFETQIDGRQWRQPVFPYQAKCLEWIRQEYRALDAPAKSTVMTLLSGTDCDQLLRGL